MVATGSQQGVWRQAFSPVVLPISKASKCGLRASTVSQNRFLPLTCEMDVC
jgi:hypothetical protein